MDDLRILRDFGEELAHEPPATLVRQRQRMLRARPRRRTFGWPMTALVAAVTAAVVAVPTLLIGGWDTVRPLAGERPVKVTDALNVLLVGTDSQAGTPRFRKGARTDTMIVLHLPADRRKVTVVSIPRDSIVEIPRCGSAPARTDMINSAFDRGGLSCAVKTVETLTGIRIDHMIEVEFAGFVQLVDALGGVEVKLERPVDDPKSKLKLPAGRNLLNGETALGYMRLRNYGDGSDIGRIKRQQQLLYAMAKKAKLVLTDPAQLRAFLAEAAKSVRTDEALDLETMAGIASSAQGSSVSFRTIPWRPHPQVPNRIQWRQPEADKLFGTLR
ncbi:LCP family protein [Nonomuraea sp. LPB2021202275-12-8]|uniref:LCP family protein n=1 Tax=Nonomuraea sp. LPB2021202275-12-8 TaxID=3120159 RepID=UPI00300CAC06